MAVAERERERTAPRGLPRALPRALTDLLQGGWGTARRRRERDQDCWAACRLAGESRRRRVGARARTGATSG
eukprot:3566208-Alexandrium_andersonii.AAC.1